VRYGLHKIGAQTAKITERDVYHKYPCSLWRSFTWTQSWSLLWVRVCRISQGTELWIKTWTLFFIWSLKVCGLTLLCEELKQNKFPVITPKHVLVAVLYEMCPWTP